MNSLDSYHFIRAECIKLFPKTPPILRQRRVANTRKSGKTNKIKYFQTIERRPVLVYLCVHHACRRTVKDHTIAFCLFYSHIFTRLNAVHFSRSKRAWSSRTDLLLVQFRLCYSLCSLMTFVFHKMSFIFSDESSDNRRLSGCQLLYFIAIIIVIIAGPMTLSCHESAILTVTIHKHYD